MRERGQTLILLAMLAMLVGCGATMPMAASPAQTDAVSAQIETLRDDQVKLLFTYDTLMGGGESQCDKLCKHHSKICSIASRICAIADAHPEHPRAATACRQANSTCSDTTQRLPNECWCRGS